MAERNETYRGLSQNWEAVAARMEELRVQELRALDVAWAMRALDDAYEAARRHAAPRLTSGLVAQQAIFMKARR